MFDAFRALFPVFALVFAFLAFGISYVSHTFCTRRRHRRSKCTPRSRLCFSFQLCVKNTIRERSRTKRRLLEAPLKPLEEKDLMLIYTLGPKPKTKHICV